MKIETHTLKSLYKQLERGDISEISRITGYSLPTVNAAFKGNNITPAYREIAEVAAKMILERRKKAEMINKA